MKVIALIFALVVGGTRAQNTNDATNKFINDLVTAITSAFNSAGSDVQQGVSQLSNQLRQGLSGMQQSMEGGMHQGMEAMLSRMLSGSDCDHRYDEQMSQWMEDCKRRAAQAEGFQMPQMGHGGDQPHPEPEPDEATMNRMTESVKTCLFDRIGFRPGAREAINCQVDSIHANLQRMHSQMGSGGGMQRQEGMGGDHGGMGGGGHDGMVGWAIGFMRRAPNCPHRNDEAIAAAFRPCHDAAAQDAGFQHDGHDSAQPEPEPTPQQMDAMKASLQRCVGQRLRQGSAAEEFRCQFQALSAKMERHQGMMQALDEAINRAGCDRSYDAQIKRYEGDCHKRAWHSVMDSGYTNSAQPQPEPEPNSEEMGRMKEEMKTCMSRGLGRGTRAFTAFLCQLDAWDSVHQQMSAGSNH